MNKIISETKVVGDKVLTAIQWYICALIKDELQIFYEEQIQYGTQIFADIWDNEKKIKPWLTQYQNSENFIDNCWDLVRHLDAEIYFYILSVAGLHQNAGRLL